MNTTINILNDTLISSERGIPTLKDTSAINANMYQNFVYDTKF